MEPEIKTTGEKCTQSGVYKCLDHPTTIPLSEGETFPPCNYDGSHGARINVS